MPEPPAVTRDIEEDVRLEGWKAIANHLGRSVRTAHRWELELGLPAHRMSTGRGEVVFAVASELDAWREALKKTANGREALGVKSDPDTEAVAFGPDVESDEKRRPAIETERPLGGSLVPEVRSRHRWPLVAVGIIALVAATGFSWWVWTSRRQQPLQFNVADGTIRILDHSGAPAWNYRFSTPLEQKFYDNYARAGTECGREEDIDGDGPRELIFLHNPDSPSSTGLYVFNSDRSLRFNRQPSRTVHFGGTPYSGPWRPTRFFVTPGQSGRMSIWVVSTHFQQFPSVLEEYDANGNLLGEYWSNGHIMSFAVGQFHGRPAVFVGAVNNEFGGSLAVLDATHPYGSAPAVLDEFSCSDCPSGRPLAFLVFPRTEIPVATGGQAAVTQINVETTGQLTVEVFQSAGGAFEKTGTPGPHTLYLLDPELRVIKPWFGDTYRAAHRLVEKQGLLDHPFDKSLGQLFPVLRNDGAGFVPIPAPQIQR